MAKGYLIGHVNVTEPGAYAEYAKAAGKLLTDYGARLLVNPDSARIVEGSFKPRTVIFEFDDFDRLNAFWASAEYQQAKALRTGAADCDFMLIAGKD